MAGEIFIADKATLDDVSIKTNNINTNVQNIISEPKSYITVSQLRNINCDRKSYAGGGTPINVSGKGSLHYVVARTSTNNSYLKVTVDGVVVFWRRIMNDHDAGSSTGIVHPGSLLRASTDNFIIYTSAYSTEGFKLGGSIVNPTYNGSQSDFPGTIILPYPLKFNTSLKVEITSNSSTENVINWYYVIY